MKKKKKNRETQFSAYFIELTKLKCYMVLCPQSDFFHDN